MCIGIMLQNFEIWAMRLLYDIFQVIHCIELYRSQKLLNHYNFLPSYQPFNAVFILLSSYFCLRIWTNLFSFSDLILKYLKSRFNFNYLSYSYISDNRVYCSTELTFSMEKIDCLSRSLFSRSIFAKYYWLSWNLNC